MSCARVAKPAYASLKHYIKKPWNTVEYRLGFNTGAIDMLALKDGERIDYRWQVDDAVLVVLRGGSSCTLRSVFKLTSRWLWASASYVVKKNEIPAHQHPLPILDAIDNEIWIDFSGAAAESSFHFAGRNPASSSHAWAQAARIKSKRTARLMGLIGKLNHSGRTYPELSALLRQVAEVENETVSSIVENAVASYIEREYPDAWDRFIQRRGL